MKIWWMVLWPYRLQSELITWQIVSWIAGKWNWEIVVFVKCWSLGNVILWQTPLGNLLFKGNGISWPYIGHACMHGHGKAWLVAIMHALGGYVETCGRPCMLAVTCVMGPCMHSHGVSYIRALFAGRRGHTNPPHSLRAISQLNADGAMRMPTTTNEGERESWNILIKS